MYLCFKGKTACVWAVFFYFCSFFYKTLFVCWAFFQSRFNIIDLLKKNLLLLLWLWRDQDSASIWKLLWRCHGFREDGFGETYYWQWANHQSWEANSLSTGYIWRGLHIFLILLGTLRLSMLLTRLLWQRSLTGGMKLGESKVPKWKGKGN